MDDYFATIFTRVKLVLIFSYGRYLTPIYFKLAFLSETRIFPHIMNEVFKLLAEGERLNESQMAEILGLSVEEVEAQLTALQREGVLLGWIPVINPGADEQHTVRAAIEVKLTPERGGGFNRLADRISRFDEVESCYLMSGAYDLLVVVKEGTLHKVAQFVAERLSTIEGVLSTATHFMLRAYKEQGYMIEQPAEDKDRLDVTP